MSNYKITNPEVIGKLKLTYEVINKVMIINSSGELESSTTTTTELGYLSGVTSPIQSQISAKADSTSLSGYVPTTTTVNGHSLASNVTITKSDVSLGNVDNTSDVNKPISTATQTALNAKADLVGGIIPISQIPPTAIERLVIVANQAARYALTTAIVQNGDTVKEADTTLMYFVKDDTNLSSAAGYEAYTAGGAASVPWSGITGIPTPVSSLSGTNTGDQDLSVLVPKTYLDTDVTLAANSDTKIATQKAVKAYANSLIGASNVTGDIGHTSFSASNNVISATNVTGLAFSTSTVRGFKALVTVSINASTNLNETFELLGVQKASGFDMAISGMGDNSGVTFSITSAGQVQYTSSNISGFVSSKINFRAQVTSI